MENLLEVIPRMIGYGEAAIYALIGYLVVFAGIAILVLVVWLVGLFFKKRDEKKNAEPEKGALAATSADIEENDEELVAVITAAIAATYSAEKRKPEFIVKKIKRI